MSELMKRDDICFYCERNFIPENYGTNKSCAKTIDHIIPVCKRGLNLPVNKVYACSECNHLKSDSTLDEFKESVELLILTKRKHYKTIPDTSFYTILKNIFILKKYVKEKGESLYKKNLSHKYTVGTTDIIDKLLPLLPVKENIRIIRESKKVKKIVKDLGFYDNPVILETEIQNKTSEYDIFLINQTPEQFRLAQKHGWKAAKRLTEPEPNFHYQ